MTNPSLTLDENPLPWLIEPDPENPGVRYFALRDLLGRPETDLEVRQARADIMKTGPVPAILDAQHPEGYWVKPGGGYTPSYRATLWQVIFLAELGADPGAEQVQLACEYVLSHSIAANDAFSMGDRPIPSSAVHCLNGDLLLALGRLGSMEDPRWQAALDWVARAIAGQDDIRYYKSGTSGSRFACGYNQGQPCAWGAAKEMRALAAVHQDMRSKMVERAIEIGIEFLLSRDPAVADYPYIDRINSSWFKFGFPLSYRSDVLEVAGVLTSLGYGDDPRLANARRFIFDKQDDQGRWIMEKSLNGKMWADIETRGEPSKWVTLQALRVLFPHGVGEHSE